MTDVFSNNDYSHLENRDRYEKLYEEVGKVEANKQIVWRECWMYYFKPHRQSYILELGAHNGPNLIHYARQGHHIDGVEISSTLIDTFYKNIIKEPAEVQLRAHMVKGWIEDFKPEKFYDYVLVTEVLEHVADPVVVLKKAFESLHIGGEVYISSPEKHWGNNTHVRGVPPEDLKKWLEDVGFYIDMLKVEHERTFCIAYKTISTEHLLTINEQRAAAGLKPIGKRGFYEERNNR